MKKVKSTFWSDFKAFISKGNILDMAVGVVIGGAFTPIVNALVNNIIMPLISKLVKLDFSAWKTVLTPAVDEVVNEAGEVVTAAVPEVAIGWGVFIAALLNFLIVALVIFTVLRVIVKSREKLDALKKKEEEAPAEEPAPAGPTTEELLSEIRDLLKDKQ